MEIMAISTDVIESTITAILGANSNEYWMKAGAGILDFTYLFLQRISLRLGTYRMKIVS